jgi:hypothetical protein
MNHSAPFIFYTERRLVVLTGLQARTLPELLGKLKEVPGACVFYHTHHRFLSQHYQKPVVYNDFAIWISEALQIEELAEKLAALDLREYTTIRALREAIIAHLEKYLVTHDGPARECPPGDEFFFCRSKSFIMPTGIVAADPPDFFRKIVDVSNVSIYFHFVEARLRLERPTNDFSQWLVWMGEAKLAEQIESLDPYLLTLDELKTQIIEVGKRNGVA